MRVNKPTGTRLFSEEQQFRQWWFWLLIVGIFLISFYGNFIAFKQVGNTPGPSRTMGLVIAVLVPLLTLTLFYLVKFETVITSEGVFYRWWPFRRKYKAIKWQDIKKAAPLERLSLSLGSKYLLGYGWKHQVSGKQGVEFDIPGAKLWIGTQRLNAFMEAVEQSSNNVATTK